MKKILGLALMLSLILALSSYAQYDDLKKAMGQFSGEDSDKPEVVDVINWNVLETFLPAEISGYEAGKVDGGTMTSMDPMGGGEFNYSSSSRTFKADGKKITVTIVDTGYRDMLLAPFSYAFEFDGPDGSVKSFKIKDYDSKQIIEKKDGKYKSAQIMSLVHKRVMVMWEADGDTTIDEIMTLAEDFDFERLDQEAAKSETASE